MKIQENQLEVNRPQSEARVLIEEESKEEESSPARGNNESLYSSQIDNNSQANRVPHSTKSNMTFEKSASDFFNLTQESNQLVAELSRHVIP